MSIFSFLPELAGQVSSVAKTLARHMPMRVCCITGDKGVRTQKEMLKEGVDVVVGTPGRLQFLLSVKQVGALVFCPWHRQ